MATTKAQLVRIGNSRGVRLPKILIEQAGLESDVELEVRGDTIVIGAPRKARQGWADAARRLRQEGRDGFLDDLGPNKFDDEEWKW